MRQSNKRSRSKQNRTRSLGNIVNRVFDSSGPEGKVRGTPQQIIDKYQVLTRDAQLSGDRVAAENFAQHAEHYTRMLLEAQAEQTREAEARREQQQQPNQNRDSDGGGGDNRGDNRGESRGDNQGGGNARSGGNERRKPRDDRRRHRDNDDPRGDQPAQGDGGSTLVETPESRSHDGSEKPAESAATPAASAADASTAQGDAPVPTGDDAPAPKKRGRPRKPRASEPAPQAKDGAKDGAENGAEPAPQPGKDAAE